MAALRSVRARWWIAGVALVGLLLPVPWLHQTGEDPIGWVWRLDGRLVVQGNVIDPPGRWSWLTVGRPPVVFEVLRDRVVEPPRAPRDMRVAPPGTQPRMIEPVAAAVGLIHAGRPLELGMIVEATGPLVPGLPDRAVIVQIDDVELRGRADWLSVAAGAGPTIRFLTDDGQWWTAPGPSLPYAHVRVTDLGPAEFSAAIGGRVSSLGAFDWFRSLSLGGSHGLMVGLVTYAHVAEEDLARGRHIAGTGGLLGDGTVTRIGGLEAKARAARRAGVDVLFVPGSQVQQLDEFDPRGMQVVPVDTLAQAIAWLQVH